MKIVVFADTGWSIGRVHADVAKHLPQHTFIFHNQGSFNFQQFIDDFKSSDICLTTLNNYIYIASLYVKAEDRKKICIVCHGVSEISLIQTHKSFQGFSPNFTYSVTSHVLIPYHPMNVYVTPNGIDPRLFTYRQRTGLIETLGWCGAHNIKVKRVDWSYTIASKCNLPLSIASTLSFENIKKWYHEIDILLVTSGPDPQVETGPLPPFEAIVCGVLVIGTSIGNFRQVPGPKFSTIDKATAIINDLKQDPEKVCKIAKEQYDFVMNTFTYTQLAKSWNTMFESTKARLQDTKLPSSH
jgi:hypothetical protein